MTEPLDLSSNYTSANYRYKEGGDGFVVENGKKIVDCSHMVNLLLTGAGYQVPYQNTAGLNSAAALQYYDVISPANVRRGDIVLWINVISNRDNKTLNHTGIVEHYNSTLDSQYGEFFGAQSSGPATAKFGAYSKAYFWPVPTKFLRVKESTRTGEGSAPAPAPAPVESTPLMNFQYPFRKADGSQFKDAEEIFKALESESAGNFLLGSHGFWHGGIHITHKTAPQCVRDEPIRCIGDGVVVAYRLNEDYLKTEFEGSSATEELEYSNSFCLVKHDYKSPPNKEVVPNTSNELVFYSLYMHLLPYQRYADEPEQTGPQKIKMIASGFKARSDVAGATGCIEYGSISAGTEIEILEEHSDHIHAKGKLIKGTVGGRTPGQDFWFAYKQNGVAYPRGDGSASWKAITAPERKKPDYWKGKVRAIVSGSGLTLRVAPSPQSNGAVAGAAMRQVNSLGQNEDLVLCTNSVIEFDSGKVFNLKIGSKLYKMAECSFVPSISSATTGLKSHSTPVPATFWACVEKPYVQLLGLVPTEFDKVVPMDTAIKAGDIIGFLGLNETLAGPDGGVSRNYQVHVEIFSADPRIEDFLKNKATLKQGKQYLHLPANTTLKGKPPVTESVTISNEKFVELGKTVLYKDAEEWYEVTVFDNTESKSGLLKKEGAELLSQHDWEKLGFRIVKELNSNSDGFLDPDDMPEFFQNLYRGLDRFGNNDQKVTPEDFPIALKNLDLRDHWSKLIAYHPTEWKSKSDSAKWARLDTMLENYPSVLKHEKERIDSLIFWDDPAIQSKGVGDGVVWHFHPIALIGNMMPSSGSNVCKKCGSNIALTNALMRSICPSSVTDTFVSEFVMVANELFPKYGVNTCAQVFHIMGQGKHETFQFSAFRESLNYTRRSYTAEKLYRMAPTAINDGFARLGMSLTREEKLEYIDQHLIANDPAYGKHSFGSNQYPHNDYRGRGLLHLTHYANYRECAVAIGVNIDANPNLVQDNMRVALESGLWFWKAKGIGSLADASSPDVDAKIKSVTRIINSGLKELDQREKFTKEVAEKFKVVFGGCSL
ncbi:glycoside hydrolase family 19 protein [Pseudomonas mercuritolerans]|uniref:Glycoside hydrolase family 19 catalytic domain-containing protein n=1 Tax=Pseudomonas mercuritolerans TaxID=2951809 RepID=A0ABT2XRL2_9PSED|nr:glycoside hydrolase family 19 protein [Pseudomonas mercuritolerans]MCV2221328.1 hypothetical protein [Pseudomonas mercuritolerans]